LGDYWPEGLFGDYLPGGLRDWTTGNLGPEGRFGLKGDLIRRKRITWLGILIPQKLIGLDFPQENRKPLDCFEPWLPEVSQKALTFFKIWGFQRLGKFGLGGGIGLTPIISKPPN